MRWPPDIRALILAALLATAAWPALAAPIEPVQVIGRFPHHTGWFTQGLTFDGVDVVQGTGRYGESRIMRRALDSLAPSAEAALPEDWFGEGVAVAGDSIWQLTWQAGVAIRYDKALKDPKEARYDGEGWGLAFDGQRLIRSDGTSRLYFHDPVTFALLGSIAVQDDGQPIHRLNELEWVNGHLLANVWFARRVAVIDMQTGSVVRWLDARELDQSTLRRGDTTLNGIAFMETEQRLFLTGKQWGAMYEIALPDWLRR